MPPSRLGGRRGYLGGFEPGLGARVCNPRLITARGGCRCVSTEIPLEYGIYAPFMLQGVHYAIYALGGVLCQKHEEHKIDGPIRGPIRPRDDTDPHRKAKPVWRDHSTGAGRLSATERTHNSKQTYSTPGVPYSVYYQ